MAKKEHKMKYSVILRDGINPNELEFLTQISRGIKLSSGAKLRELSCTEMQDIGAYMEMNVFKPGDDWVLPLRLPHHYIFLISGQEPHGNAAGFVWPVEKE
jgi:hypothetical protein